MFLLVWWLWTSGYDFAPKEELTEQVDGWAYTLTPLIVLLYIFSGFYLFMESRYSDVEVQKKFYVGLAFLFIFIGLAQGAVSLYSIVNAGGEVGIGVFPEGTAAQIIPYPDNGLLTRGDVALALAFAGASSVIIIPNIEKYILASKKKVLTGLIFAGFIGSIMMIAGMYLTQGTTPSWWEIFEYVAIALMAIGLGITILALPIVYFRLAGQTSGDLKKNSLTIAFGYLITFVMVLAHMLLGGEIPLGWILFLFINFIGAMILLAGYLKSTY